MIDTNTPPLRLTGPRDMIAAVPYLLGFTPEASLVLIGLDGQRLVVTARIDLADTADALLDTLEAIARGGATSVIVVVFSNDCAPEMRAQLPETDTITALQAQAAGAGLTVIDALLVCDGRWWSYLCQNSECCPPQGNPLADDERVAADCSYLGMAPHASRESLAAVLDPDPAAERLTAAIETEASYAATQGPGYVNSAKRAIFAAARRQELSLSDAELVRFALALTRIEIREAVWMAIDDGRLPKRELWLSLARRLPAPYNAPALFLYGWGAWRSGNGVLAGTAAEQAVAADPDYNAADLLLAALTRGINPKNMPKLRLPRGVTLTPKDNS